MTLFAFVYAFLLGPWFSVGFVLMLFIHEMGHIWAMKLKGMPTRAPVFIPFIGAVIFVPPFKTRQDEAFVGYAGPLVGGAAAAALFGVWLFLSQKSEVILLISYTAAFLNLFNLIPIRPLDGGRITQIVGEWFKYLGIAGLLLFTLYIKEPAFLMIWILVLTDIRMKPWLKFGTGAACQLSMMILMAFGFSGQVWWINIFDVLIASLFNTVYFAEATSALERDIEDSKLTPVPVWHRRMWLILYFALVGTLVLLMILQIPYLPHPVKSKAVVS